MNPYSSFILASSNFSWLMPSSKYYFFQRISGIAFALFLSSCSGKPAVSHFYQTTKEYFEKLSQGSSPDGVLGTSGDIKVTRGDFRYASSDLESFSGKDLDQLPDGMRTLLIKKMLLRRMAVEQGLKEGIFDTPEAAGYILPRLERILDEYYYYQKADFERMQADSQKIIPDEEALKEFSKSRPGTTPDQAHQAASRIAQEAAMRRFVEKRRLLMEELIRKYPTIEVSL